MNFLFHLSALLSLLFGVALLVTINAHRRARRERRYYLAERLKGVGFFFLFALILCAAILGLVEPLRGGG